MAVLTAVRVLEAGEEAVFVAHRMGNTRAGLRLAEEAGADIVEADVFLHRGRLEVRHTKTMGPVPLLWDRWSLERGWRPRFLLRELVAAAAPGTLLMLDLKRDAPGLSAAVAAMMREVAPERSYLVCSQVWGAVQPFEHEGAATPVPSIGNERALRRFFLRENKPGAWVSIHERLVTAASAARLRDAAAFVMSWPVNTEERMDSLLELGVRGMITDRLDLVRGQT